MKSNMKEYFNAVRKVVIDRGLEPSDFNAEDTEQAVSDWGYYFVCGELPIDALKREYPNIEW